MPLRAIAPHLFTSRAITLSRAHDDPGVAAVAASLGVTPQNVVQVHQVHGCAVLVAGTAAASRADAEADVLLSDDPARAVAVRVADCAPILIADRRRRVVAAVHAGWRGTASGAAPAGVRALREAFGCEPADLVVAIGPLIRACCYEVGPETRAHFPERVADRWFSSGGGDRLQLDVAKANGDQLEASGVPRESIHDSGLCTACHRGTFHSYRKDGSQAGRMMGIIRPAG